MNNVFLTFLLLLVIKVLVSQDTLINGREITIFDKKNKVTQIYKFKNDLNCKHGEYRMSFSGLDGNHIVKGVYSNNMKEGKWYTFINDTLAFIQTYRNGVFNGTSTKFEKGEKVFEKNYKDGLIKGYTKMYKDSKLIIKGRYSGKYFDYTYSDTDSLVIFNFSNGQRVSFRGDNQIAFDSFLDKYHIFVPFNRNWLKKGKWKYYSSTKKLIEIQEYNRFGVLMKIRIIKENDLWKDYL